MYSCQPCMRRCIQSLLAESLPLQTSQKNRCFSKSAFPNRSYYGAIDSSRKPRIYRRGGGAEYPEKTSAESPSGLKSKTFAPKRLDNTRAENAHSRSIRDDGAEGLRGHGDSGQHAGTGSRSIFANKSSSFLQSREDYVNDTLPEGMKSDNLPTEWESSYPVLAHEVQDGEQVKAQAQLDFEERKLLQHMHDPVLLAEKVRSQLRDGKFEEAESLVRLKSKDDKYIVCWNHLIDWQASKGKLNGAVKTYNEMKKRGQVPDAHTFTILLRGMADNAHYPQALSKALSLYHSMDAPNSPVHPNIIHTNAVLKVCARAGDLDAMFGIAGKLKASGMRAPNNLTFTTILNAVRANAERDTDWNLKSSELIPVRTKAISDSRRMWIDIINRWRSGDFRIDEELVCSMGRILLLGTNRDMDDVFSLIEQTMNIKRLMPKLGTPARRMIEPSEQGNLDSKPLVPESPLLDTEVPAKLPDEFLAITPPAPRSPTSSSYVLPGRNSLSLVLETLLKLNIKSTASQYWGTFTKIYKVVPDSNNYHNYLRLLRVFRASTETVKLLEQMPQEMYEKKTFRLAMAACVRDKNNTKAFANAGKCLDLMQQSFAAPDIHALQSYLEVAIRSPAYSRKVSSSGSHDLSKLAQGRQLERALSRLSPSFINIKATLAYAEAYDKADESRPPFKIRRWGDEAAAPSDYWVPALELTRTMISCYDRLLNNGMVPRDDFGRLMKERSKLAAFATRYHEKHRNSQGKWGSKIVASQDNKKFSIITPSDATLLEMPTETEAWRNRRAWKRQPWNGTRKPFKRSIFQ